LGGGNASKVTFELDAIDWFCLLLAETDLRGGIVLGCIGMCIVVLCVVYVPLTRLLGRMATW